jgi:Protein of unknown function (DUF2867).
MKKVIRSKIIPENSLVLNGFEKVVDYCDIYQVQKETEKSAEEISRDIMQMPKWALILFKLRNRIVGVFGLKTDKNTEKTDNYFTLIENVENEIVMGEVDKHLDFRISVLKNNSEKTISVTTVVHYNNIWGNIYFFPVKPFHKIIVKTMMKRYLKNL